MIAGRPFDVPPVPEGHSLLRVGQRTILVKAKRPPPAFDVLHPILKKSTGSGEQG